MDTATAILLTVGWAGVAVVFGFGWLRCGNRHWRWQPHRQPCSPNAPIYGLICFAAVCNMIVYLLIALPHVFPHPSSSAMFLARILGQVPLLLTFFGVAMIRRPWSSD